MAVDAQLGRANVAIRATLDQLDKDLAGARKRTSSAVSQITSKAGQSFQTLGKVALGGIGVATGAVAGLAGALGKVAVDAMPVQGIQDAFAGIADSAGTSQQEMLAALEEGSAGMISQRDLMMSFNKAAQLVSPTFAKQLPDAMQYLSKVSAATGEDMGFMMDSLVTGVGRMSPMILDNLGIQVKLSDATERAAEMFGVEASALTDAQVQAGMMDVVLQKLQENTASMPDVTQSAAAQWARMQATFQNVKDQVGMALLPVLGSLMTTFSRILEVILPPLVGFIEGALAPALQTVASVFGAFVEGLLQGMTPIQALQMALTTMGFPELGEQIGGIVGKIQGFVSVVAQALSPVINWVKENVKLQDILVALGAAIASVIIPALASVLAAVAPIIAVFAAVALAVAALRTAWQTNFLGIRDRTQAVITFVRTFIETALAAIQAFWQAHGEEIMAFVSTMFNTIRTVITTIITVVRTFIETALAAIQAFWHAHGEDIMAFVSAMFNTILTVITTIITVIWTVIQTVLGAIKAFWQAHGDSIKAIANAAWSGIKAAVTTIINVISAVVSAVLGAIQGFWQAHGDTIMTLAQNAWDTIKTIVEAAITIVGEIIDAVSSAIEGDWRGFGESLRTIWDTAWETIKTVLSNAWDSIKTIVQDLIKSIKSFFTDTDWGEIGGSIIDGIKQGISNAAGRLAEAARNAARAAYEAAKGFLGINCPDPSPLTEELGIGMGEGLVEGLRQSMPALERAATELVNAGTNMPALAIGALGGGGSSFQREVHYHLEANYRYQDEASLADDVRFLTLMSG